MRIIMISIAKRTNENEGHFWEGFMKFRHDTFPRIHKENINDGILIDIIIVLAWANEKIYVETLFEFWRKGYQPKTHETKRAIREMRRNLKKSGVSSILI